MRKYYFKLRWHEQFLWHHFDHAKKGCLCFTCSKACKINLFKVKFRAAFIQLGRQLLLIISSISHKQQEEAKIALHKIFTSLKYLVLQGLAIHSHSNVPELCNWMQRRKNLCSGDVQNEMLQIMAHNVLRSIASDIHFVDETADVAGVDQVSINIRIVKDLEPEESIGELLFKLVVYVLRRFNIQFQNMGGRCYDEAANMFGMFTVIILRGRRSLEKYVLSSGVRPLCPTRWTARVASISGILNTHNSILAMLSNIAESTEEISSRARGLLDLLTKVELYLGFLVCRDVFTPRDRLSSLQDQKLTVAGGREAISCTVIRNYKKFDDLRTKMTEQTKILELEKPKPPRNEKQ
ncbi:hypothetical protein PR048_022396 [Dryococelus australis]|uniref:Uncharacterized protein n=1 Tax=Dryococelus australis TaxID=614101 RepID=A0ABQ9H0X6_9NEOP|nr:hypothetical protein PR048_022396 [Dryococelus australis]